MQDTFTRGRQEFSRLALALNVNSGKRFKLDSLMKYWRYLEYTNIKLFILSKHVPPSECAVVVRWGHSGLRMGTVLKVFCLFYLIVVVVLNKYDNACLLLLLNFRCQSVP